MLGAEAAGLYLAQQQDKCLSEGHREACQTTRGIAAHVHAPSREEDRERNPDYM